METHRHLLFASDAWLGNAVLEEPAPYHPLGFPAGGMPAEQAAGLGLTLGATPTLDEVLAPRPTADGHDASRRRTSSPRPSWTGPAVASRRRRIPTRSTSSAAASRWCSRKRPSTTAMPCATSPCSRLVSGPSNDRPAADPHRGRRCCRAHSHGSRLATPWIKALVHVRQVVGDDVRRVRTRAPCPRAGPQPGGAVGPSPPMATSYRRQSTLRRCQRPARHPAPGQAAARV